MTQPNQEPSKATQEQVLYEELNAHIERYTKKQHSNRYTTEIIRALLIAAGSLTTVVLGVKSYAQPQFEHVLSISALLLSAFATGLAAWEGFAEHSQRWVQAHIVLGQLHEIRDDLEFARPVGIESSALSDSFNRMKEVLREDNEHWASTRAGAIIAATPRPATPKKDKPKTPE